MASAKLKSVKVGLKLPLLTLEGIWEADQAQQEAAWELHVELATRIAAVHLADNEGLSREALSSLYSIFASTREILRRNGPAVGRPQKNGQLTFASIAVAVLNLALRPVLAKWHPLLLDHEAKRPPGMSSWEWEQPEHWDKARELRAALNTVRAPLRAYADLLAQAADVASLLPGEPRAASD
jgi:hypothetical protein